MEEEIHKSNGFILNVDGWSTYKKGRKGGNSIFAIFRHLATLLDICIAIKYAALAKFISLLYIKYKNEGEDADVNAFIQEMFASKNSDAQERMHKLKDFLKTLLPPDKVHMLDCATGDGSIVDALIISINMLLYIDSELAESLQTLFGSAEYNTIWQNIFYTSPREISSEGINKSGVHFTQTIYCTADKVIVKNTNLDGKTTTKECPPIHLVRSPSGSLHPQGISVLLDACKKFVQEHFLQLLYSIIRSKCVGAREEAGPYKILFYNYFWYGRLVCTNLQPFSPFVGEIATLRHRVSRSAERQHAGDNAKFVCCDIGCDDGDGDDDSHNIRLNNTQIQRCVINIRPITDGSKNFRLTVTGAGEDVNVDNIVITPMNYILDVETSMDQPRKLTSFVNIIMHILGLDAYP